MQTNNQVGLKICQVVSHYPPAYHFGGALQVAHALSKSLAAQGHEVRVCTSNLKDLASDLDVPTGASVEMDGAQVYYDPVRLSRYWGLSPAMTRRVWEVTEWADVVLMHFHYQFASLAGAWASRLRTKPYIIFTHGSLNQYGVNARSNTRKRLYLNLLERGNFHRALFAAYHSQEELETSLKFGRCAVVPNGIDPRMFADRPPRGSFRERYPELDGRTVFLFLGRLDAGKGLDLLLPAFHTLAESRPDVHLVLAGGNERGYEAQVRRMIAELGLAERVTLTGLISGAQKIGALQDADAYVLPSRSEGLSIAMLEAMYMGLPVIVTDRVGLWRTIEEKQCGLVVPLEEARLADALRRMAEDKGRAEMGRRGHDLVAAQYTWDVISRNLAARIKESIV